MIIKGAFTSIGFYGRCLCKRLCGYLELAIQTVARTLL
jgi:hypothetical protein